MKRGKKASKIIQTREKDELKAINIRSNFTRRESVSFFKLLTTPKKKKCYESHPGFYYVL